MTKINAARTALFAVGTVVAVLVSTSCAGQDDSSSTSSSPLPTASSPQSATPTPSAASAGSAVRDGKFEFQVMGVTTAPQAGDLSNQFLIVKAQGEFVIVTMMVTNVGDSAQSYFGGNQKLIDASGHEYSVNSSADLWMNKGTGDIQPGKQVQATAAFDVPPGTVPVEIDVHESMFSNGAKLRL